MDLFSILLCGLVVAALLDTFYLNVICKRFPGTIRLPFIGDLALVGYHFGNFFDWMTVAAREYDAVPLPMWLGRYCTWGLTHPRDIEYILKTNWKNFTVGDGIRGEAAHDLFGDGIFHADGDCWYTQRKTVSREFTMNNFRDFMLREFLHYSNMMRDRVLCAAKEGSPLDLHALFYKLTLDSFGKVAFGVDLGGLAGVPQPFAKAFDDAQDILAWRVARKPAFLWKTQRALQIGSERTMTNLLGIITEFVTKLLDQRLAERRQSDSTKKAAGNQSVSPDAQESETRQDLFDRLVTVSENEKDSQKRIKYLRDMCVNFMIAGRDTTACALSWLSYELTKAPEVEAKMVDELLDVFPSEGAAPTYDGMNSCHYLMAVVHEALRLHPSVPFDIKHCQNDAVLPSNGQPIKAGDTVAYVAYVMGRLESIWGPDATTFRPERFLDEEGRFVRPDQFKFPVFQAGPRLCLGMEMAILEMKAVIATLYRQMSFKLVKEPHYRTGVVLQMLPPGLQVQPVLRGSTQQK